MSTTPEQASRHQRLAQANEAIRAFVRTHGDRPWTPEELAELDRLRAAWQAAGREHGQHGAATRAGTTGAARPCTRRAAVRDRGRKNAPDVSRTARDR